MVGKKVLITGLFTQAGIFSVRRFGQLGFEVTAADNHRLAFGMYSKYVNKRIQLPSLKKNPVGYAKAVIEELEKGKYDYYFPAFEELYLMSHFKHEIPSHTKTIIPDYDKIIRLHDKLRLAETCKEAGVAYPETFSPKTYNEFLDLSINIDRPVYVKIKQSRNSTGIRCVDDPRKLINAYDDVIERNQLDESKLPIIQEKIHGPEIAYAALAQNGEVIGESQHMGIRYIPRAGGTTTCRKTVFDKVCSEEAARFVKHIGWTGFISIDFMVDKATGKPYIIDVNPRASVCINVGFYGGVDKIPQWIRIADGLEAEVLPQIKPEVKSSTHFADVMWLLYTYTKGPESWEERKKFRKDWWKNRKEIHYDIISKEDRRPRWILNTFLAVQLLRSVFSRREPSGLFLEYNVFHEDIFKKQIAKPKNEEVPELECSFG